MNNFYKGGRGLAFSQREGGASSRKEKPPRLPKILTNQIREGGAALPSATVREVVDVSSEYPRDLFDTGSGAVREVFDCCSGGSRRTTEAHPKQYRSCPEPVPKRTRSAPEGHPNSTRRNRWRFCRFFDVLKARITYRCSKDVVLFTQLLRKIAEVPLMYRECTVSVRGVYRKGTGDLLRSYWRSTTDLLNACTSDVDQRYSKSRRVVEAMKNKAIPLMRVWLCFMLFNLSDAWAQSAIPRTAEGQTEIRPLQIGDTIPEAIWNMPLQTVKHGRETKEIRLGDYRGKVIILDYWATWCAGCILSMPKMHNIAEEMGDEVALLAVTRQDEQIVSRYLKVTTSKQIKKLRDSFSTIVSGNALADLIPHRSLPHIAIINKHGVLEQTTLPHLLNTSILQSIATGNDYYLPVMRLDVDTTLLSQTFPDIRHDKPIYYATLMGYVDGFAAPSKHSVDSLANITRGYFINTSILRVMNIALQSKGVGLLPNRRIMLVDKPSSYDYFHERNPNYQRREFSVSYEYAFPINWSRERINSRILSDIEDYRSLYGKMVRWEIPCLVLKKKKGATVPEVQRDESSGEVIDGVLAFTREQREVGLSSSGAKNYLRGVSLGALESILNNLKTGAVPFVINETGIDYNIHLDLPDDLDDVDSLIKTLEKQGILVMQERRALDMFVMDDEPIDTEKIQSADLVLTKFGYVLEKEVDND